MFRGPNGHHLQHSYMRSSASLFNAFIFCIEIAFLMFDRSCLSPKTWLKFFANTTYSQYCLKNLFYFSLFFVSIVLHCKTSMNISFGLYSDSADWTDMQWLCRSSLWWDTINLLAFSEKSTSTDAVFVNSGHQNNQIKGRPLHWEVHPFFESAFLKWTLSPRHELNWFVVILCNEYIF